MAYLLAMGGHRLDLTRERTSFGSNGANDVPIPENFGLADKHFDLVSTGNANSIRLEICPGAPGVFLNGNAVTQGELKTGDELRAGDLIVTFHADPAPAASAPADLPAPVEAPAEAVSEPAATAPAPAPLVGNAPVLDFGSAPAAGAAAPDARTKPSRSKPSGDSVSGKKLGKVALIGGLSLAILGGGVFAAQKTGVLDYALNSAPEDHFDFLAENLPSGMDTYVTFDLGRLITAYPEIASNSEGALPPLDVISGQLKQAAGFQLTGLDRITAVAKMPPFGDISLMTPDAAASRFVAAVSMKDKASMRALASHMKEKAKESGQEGLTTVRWGRKIMIEISAPVGPKLMVYAPRGRHFLIGDSESMLRMMEGDLEQPGGLNDIARQTGGTIAMAIDGKVLAPYLKDFDKEENLKGLKTLAASLDIKDKLSSKCIMNFSTPKACQAFAQVIKSGEWKEMVPPEALPEMKVSVKGTQTIIEASQEFDALKKGLQQPGALVDTQEFGEPRTQEE